MRSLRLNRAPDPSVARPRLELLTGHSNTVSCVAFSPDGRTLASGGEDGSVILWDVERAAMLRRLPPHPRSVISLLETPAAGTEPPWHSLVVLDLETLECERRWVGQQDVVSSVAFSPDGKLLLVVGLFPGVRIWDLDAGIWVPVIAELRAAAAFSRDGRFLVGVRDTEALEVTWWNLAERAIEYAVTPTPQPGSAVRWTVLAGERLAGVTEHEVILWDARTGEQCGIIPHAFGEMVPPVALSSDGGALALVFHDRIALCDTRTGQWRQVYSARFDWETGLAFGPDGGSFATGSGWGTVRTWDFPDMRVRETVVSRSRPGERVAALSYSPDAMFLGVGGGDHSVSVWRIGESARWRRFPGMEFSVLVLACSPDGATLASGHSDHSIRLWDTQTGELRRTLLGHHRPVTRLAFSPDGKALVSGASGTWEAASELISWDPGRGEPQRMLSAETYITSLTFTADSKLLVASWTMRTQARETVSEWDLDTGERTIRVAAAHCALSPDGSVLATKRTGRDEIELREVETGRVIRRLCDPDEETLRIGSLRFAPDGRTLAAGYWDGFWVALWDGETGRLLRRLETHMQFASAIACSPDGELLAVGGDLYTAVQVWDFRRGIVRRTLAGHANRVGAVAFSPDGKHLISGSSDGTIQRWHVKNGSLVATSVVLPAVEGLGHEWITYTPRGDYVGSAEVARFIRWDVGKDLLPAHRCEGRFHRPDRVQQALEKG